MTDDVFIVKYNSGGNELWGTGSGGPGYDIPVALNTDVFGSILVAGYFQGPMPCGSTTLVAPVATESPYSDFFVAKLGDATTTGIEKEENPGRIKLFPNLVTDWIMLQTNGSLSDASLIFENNLGQTVKRFDAISFAGNQTVELSCNDILRVFILSACCRMSGLSPQKKCSHKISRRSIQLYTLSLIFNYQFLHLN